MAEAVKFNEILVLEGFAGGLYYAVCEAYKAEIGDRVETAAGFGTVKKKYLDLDGDMYRVLTELNTVLIVHAVWSKSWSGPRSLKQELEFKRWKN